MKLKIYFPTGAPYIVDENGNIERTDMVFTASGNWKFLGIQHVKKNWYIPFTLITQEWLDNNKMLWKNGNPQFTGRDKDHGTVRVWGNTKYHGISKIEII